MEPTVVKAEISPLGVEITYSDGTSEEIKEGRFERKDASGRTVEQRPATEADATRLLGLAAEADGAEREVTLADGTKIEAADGNIEVTHPDGTKEEIEGGVYERKDVAGDTVEERAATDADVARLSGLIPEDLGSVFDLGSVGPGTEFPGQTLIGDDGDDRLRGDDGDDVLDGLGGDDSLRGGDGDDTLSGGDGDDRLRGDKGNDDLDGGAGNDRVRGKAGDDTVLGGDGRDRVRGDKGDDDVDGGAGADRVKGGRGDDTVVGGTGDDRLWGNGGADLFVIAPGDGSDKIHDFVSGTDRIDLAGFGFADFDAILAAMDDAGNDLLIDLGDGEVLRLDDLAGADLVAADFGF